MTYEEKARIGLERQQEEGYFQEQEKRHQQAMEDEYYERQEEGERIAKRKAKKLGITLERYYKYLENKKPLDELRR